MQSSRFKILYEDEDVLVIDKPAGVNSDDFEKRVHRLDKDTSGILLIAKNDKSLEFLQKQFSAAAKSYGGSAEAFGEGGKDSKVFKRYLALVVGHLKNDEGKIETLIGRAPKDRRKQKVYLSQEPGAKGKRGAITNYKVLQRLENYDLIEVEPKTGRKHQIRTHFTYLGHPIAGDKLYGFKNQPCPKGLKRQFLHATCLKITLPNGKIKEFHVELPEDLKQVLTGLK